MLILQKIAEKRHIICSKIAEDLNLDIHQVRVILNQLKKSKFIESISKEKNIVVGEPVDWIENNSIVRVRVINALKAGGKEAFKEAVDHPMVNILVATIEGWQENE
jgi:DNA-binding IscR family transcriptional regulator